MRKNDAIAFARKLKEALEQQCDEVRGAINGTPLWNTSTLAFRQGSLQTLEALIESLDKVLKAKEKTREWNDFWAEYWSGQ